MNLPVSLVSNTLLHETKKGIRSIGGADCRVAEKLELRRRSVMAGSRLIRRQPLWARIQSWPIDTLLSWSEDWDMIDWDAVAQTISLPAGIAINVLYWLLLQYINSAGSNASFKNNSEKFRSSVFRSVSNNGRENVLRTSSSSPSFGRSFVTIVTYFAMISSY